MHAFCEQRMDNCVSQVLSLKQSHQAFTQAAMAVCRLPSCVIINGQCPRGTPGRCRRWRPSCWSTRRRWMPCRPSWWRPRRARSMRARTRGRQTREPQYFCSDAAHQTHHNAPPMSGSCMCNFPERPSPAPCSIKLCCMACLAWTEWPAMRPCMPLEDSSAMSCAN